MNAQAPYLFIILLCLAFNAIIGYYVLYYLSKRAGGSSRADGIRMSGVRASCTKGGIKTVP
jgi:hypothetical protein